MSRIDKHSITTTLPSQPHEFLVAGKIDGDLGSPTQLERGESLKKLLGSSWYSDDVVIDKVDEAIVQSFDFFNDLLNRPEAILDS